MRNFPGLLNTNTFVQFKFNFTNQFVQYVCNLFIICWNLKDVSDTTIGSSAYIKQSTLFFLHQQDYYMKNNLKIFKELKCHPALHLYQMLKVKFHIQSWHEVYFYYFFDNAVKNATFSIMQEYVFKNSMYYCIKGSFYINKAGK